jgi:hypothetical protein
MRAPTWGHTAALNQRERCNPGTGAVGNASVLGVRTTLSF